MVRDQLPIVKLGKLLPQPYKNGIYKSADFYGDGTQILRITDFDNEGHLVTDELQCLHLENNEVENYKLTSRDIVINRVNSLTHIGKSILWLNNTDCTTVYESNMMRIQPDESAILPEYLIRILQSEPAREHFRKVAKRAVAQCSINQQDVKSLSFPLHPLQEQKKIAQILSTWDRAISSTEQLLANSQQQKKALMQQLLTGKKRVGIPDKSYEFQKNRYGTIPKDWEYPAIKDICTQVTQKNTVSADYPVLSCSKYDGFVDSLKYFKKKVYSDDTSGYRLIHRGCFGFPSNHVEEGSIGLQNLYETGIVSPIYVVFRAKTKRVDNDYLYAVLKTDHYRQIFGAATNASVDRRGSLRWKEFSLIHVPLPPLDEQQKIAAVLSTADKEITALQQKLDALKQEKKALMQQLLTGKRRVKV